MSSGNGARRRYHVHNSGAIAREFLRLQQQASLEGRGAALLQAGREVYRRLRNDPNEFGEPLYRLPSLRLQIRCATVRPLYIDFAVHEDRPLVFIKAVKLLSPGDG